MSDKTIVSSWNEWDPLKHVIVGKAEGTCIPAPEPALDAKVPEDSDMRGQFGPRTKDTVDKANQLLNDFLRCIAKRVSFLGGQFSAKSLQAKVSSLLREKGVTGISS